MEKVIHNIETDEISVIPLTDDEIKERNDRAIEFSKIVQHEKEQEILKIQAKAELLAKLGITEEEAKLLLS